METAAAFADVDALHRTASKHKRSTYKKRTKKGADQIHGHPKCERCGALTDREGVGFVYSLVFLILCC